ncbi:hypothetical protein JCM10213_008070 [Rhodosporidiobolus nylandii]
MDDEELRLPTPPPLPPGAPAYRIPFNSDRFPRFATLENPGPVHSVDRALDQVGGVTKLADVLANPAHNKHVELNLQPDNPFFHTIPAHVADTRNVVVKITKRRRKRPVVGFDGAVIEEGVFTIEPVGIEHKTVRFRAMADFQFTPKIPKSDPTLALADAIRSMDIAGIRNFTMPEPAEDFPESLFLPPPSFSRHGLPQMFDMRAATSTVRQTTESGSVRLINATRHKTRALQTVLFVQPDVPKGPEETFLKELGRTELTEIETRMRGLLEVRPVWTRQGMLNQLAPDELKIMNNNKNIWPIIGYTFGDGPFRDLVVRFGYDPRQDPEARFYQNIQFRNAQNVREKALPGTRGLIQANSARNKKDKEKAPATSNLSHEFDGQHVSSKVGNFQLCDISDPLCASLISSTAGLLDQCSSDANEGWFAYDYIEQIRQIVRRKWQALLNGYRVEDEDCADLLAWECSAESRAGQARSRAAPTPAPKEGGGKGKGKAPRKSAAGGKSKAAKKGKGRARSGSESASASDTPSGSGGGSDDDDDGDDSSRASGSGGDGWSSAGDAGPSSSTPGPSGAQGKKQRRKQVRAPWEQPRSRKNKVKAAEPENLVLSRLSRSVRRNSRGVNYHIPHPDEVEDEEDQ